MNKKLNSILIIGIFIISIYSAQSITVNSQMKPLSFELLSEANSIEKLEDQELIYKDNYLESISLPKTNEKLVGTQKVAVILARFLGTTTRYSVPEVEEIYETVADFWGNTSDHYFSLDIDIFGWYELDDTFEGFNQSGDGSWRKWDRAHEAIDLADDDCDFTQYDCVQVMFNIDWRCVSNVGKSTNRETDDGTINVALSLVFEKPSQAYDKVIYGIFHELGHSFGLPHTHGGGTSGEKNYASYYSLMARGLSAVNGFQMHWNGITAWIDQATEQVIVNPGNIVQGYIKPRYIDITNEPQYIVVKVSNSIYYRIEVIEKQSEDALLAHDEGVYIYLVDENQHWMDQCTDMDSTPFSQGGVSDLKDCLWTPGQNFYNATYNVNITIINKVGNDYEVRVENLGDGYPDVMINPWGNPPGNPGPWESIDVWVDSPINNYDNYRYTDNLGNPISIGDDPWANHENKLYARIHNTGEGVAEDVDVFFYEKIPISAGDDNNWDIIGTAKIPLINAGDSVEVAIPWTPEISVSNYDNGLMKLHGCVFVTIEEQPGEIDTKNNKCQENIAYYEITADDGDKAKLPSSTFNPITTKVDVNNPYNVPMILLVDVINHTSKWIVEGVGLGNFTHFGPLETKEYEITITPGDEVRLTEKFEGELIICEEVSGADSVDFEGDDHLIIVGGCSFHATVSYRSEMDLEIQFRTGGIDIMGQMNFLDNLPISKFPQTIDERTVLIEITNSDQETTEYYTALIDPNGDFSYSYSISTQGNYLIKAYFGGTEFIATSSSVTINVDTINSSIWTSSQLFSGFEVYVLLGTISITTILLKLKQRKTKNK